MAIQLSDLTNGSTKREVGTQPVWEGTAIFDVLMKAVNENINIQYELTRITGSDYATVYLGAIETCIKESTNLLLQKAIADKEIEVKQAQILNIQEDTRLKTAQASAFPLQAAQELALTTEQVLTQKEDTKLKAAQAIAYPLQSEKDLEVKNKEIEYKDQQILNMQSDDNIKQEQSTKDLEVKTAQISKINDDLLTAVKQRELVVKDLEVKSQQILSMKNDDSVKSVQSAKDLDVKTAQINVANEEKRLKAAQADAYPLQAAKDALLKQVQVDLYERQIEGFDDNKRQKLFDSSVNGWALAYSSGILDKATIPTFINDASMTQLFNTIKA